MENQKMLKNIEDLQSISQQNADLIIKSMRSWNRCVQTIATHMVDFAARTTDDGAAALEAMMAAKSIEEMVEINGRFFKRTYEGGVGECGKIGGVYASLAKDAFVPVERIFSRSMMSPLLRRNGEAQP
jgi:hypothetical protein